MQICHYKLNIKSIIYFLVLVGICPGGISHGGLLTSGNMPMGICPRTYNIISNSI